MFTIEYSFTSLRKKRPVISVLRSFARPQADGKLKNDLFVQENSFELTMIFFHEVGRLIFEVGKIVIRSKKFGLVLSFNTRVVVVSEY